MPKGQWRDRSKYALFGLTRDELVRLYEEEKLSQGDIARRLGVTQGAILYWFRKWGIPARSHDDALILMGKSGRFTGDKNPKWTGGKHLSPNGYWMIRKPDHHAATSRGYVREHLMVWEEANGKPLPKGWHIHHKNGVKTDNRPENLEAMTRSAHRMVLPELMKRIGELEQQLQEAHDEIKRLRRDGSRKPKP